MPAIPDLTEDEAYLAAIFDDPSGIELAEFAMVDEESADGCFRVYCYQWNWWRSEDRYQIEQASRDVGKALALDTPIPTPSGMTTMGELEVGDLVYGLDGMPVRVLAAHPVRYDRPCYEVEFSTGDVITADGEHLWTVRDMRHGGRYRTLTTEDLLEGGVRFGPRQDRHWLLDVAQPTRGLRGISLPVPPWLLGYWLGDGTKESGQITVGAQDVETFCERVKDLGYAVDAQDRGDGVHYAYLRAPDGTQFGRQLTAIGAKAPAGRDRAFKKIPEAYLLSSIEDRLELLRGFMDADGSVVKGRGNGRVSFDQMNETLARQLKRLACSLGETPYWREGDATLDGRVVGTRYRVGWTAMHFNPFSYERKARHVSITKRLKRRAIVAIRPVESAPVRCIGVDSPDNLFLAGEGHIPTHNTLSVILRSLAFPLCFPGAEMLITAPELSHLRPITDKVENAIMRTRLLREMLPKRRGNGINRQPHFQVQFDNGATIISRIPQRDGRGVKGIHALRIEMDECFPAGTLVMTKRGQVPIEDIQKGDQVWTHRNRWRTVTKTFDRGPKEVLSLRGQGHPGLVVTPDHKFWAVPIKFKGKSSTLGGRPTWVPAGELQRGGLWGSPTRVDIAAPKSIPRPRTGPNRAIEITEDFMEMLGWFVAEGSTQPSGKVNFSITPDEVSLVAPLLDSLGLNWWVSSIQSTDECVNLTTSHIELARFLSAECGRGARNKKVPVWVLGMSESMRLAALRGVIRGDGFLEEGGGPRGTYKADRWKVTTGSKSLMVSLRLLALSLDWHVSAYWSGPRKKPSFIRGREIKSDGWYQVVGSSNGMVRFRDDSAWSRVREATPAGVQDCYDLEVDEDHSFVVDGFYVHNSQDYSPNGFTEIVESMKARMQDSQWRIHGVSRGVADRFTQLMRNEDPNLPFKVHSVKAMHRPTWGNEERRNKIALYGGTEEHVDYKRNVLGEMSDASSTLFVAHRLMSCVRIAESPWATKYNDDIYAKIKISDDLLRGSGAPIETFLQFNGAHLADEYTSFWAGLDVGFTRDPSELLVFGELKHPSLKGQSLLRLLLRVHMMRVSAADQAAVVRAVFEFYGPRLRRATLDKTGVGLPLWQELDPEAVGTHVDLRRTPAHISQRIKGYGFSNKVAVEFDDRELQGRELAQDAVIEKNVVSFAADEARKLVDMGHLELPFDQELLQEWQGQEIQYVRDDRSAAGLKTKLVGGSLHTLDSALMCIAGRNLMHIEEALKVVRPAQQPVLAQFML